MDCLKLEGNSPVDRDRLMILVIVGARTERHFFSRKVGSGSESHCTRDGFLIKGVIMDCLKLEGNSPVDKEDE
mgnify:FL=1